jgi:protein SCO1/2
VSRGGKLAVVATAVVAAGAAAAAFAATRSAPASAFNGVAIPGAAAAPKFVLHDQAGRRISLAAERGKVVVVTFLYTRCHDVCPLIAANLNAALRGLGANRRNAAVLAVSVDPEGDTRAAVSAFVRRLHLLPQFHYLIGSRDELERIWAAYGVVSLPKGPGVVDHSALTVAVDRDGVERLAYPSRATAAQIEPDLRRLLAAG